MEGEGRLSRKAEVGNPGNHKKEMENCAVKNMTRTPHYTSTTSNNRNILRDCLGKYKKRKKKSWWKSIREGNCQFQVVMSFPQVSGAAESAYEDLAVDRYC